MSAFWHFAECKGMALIQVLYLTAKASVLMNGIIPMHFQKLLSLSLSPCHNWTENFND